MTALNKWLWKIFKTLLLISKILIFLLMKISSNIYLKYFILWNVYFTHLKITHLTQIILEKIIFINHTLGSHYTVKLIISIYIYIVSAPHHQSAHITFCLVFCLLGSQYLVILNPYAINIQYEITVTYVSYLNMMHNKIEYI